MFSLSRMQWRHRPRSIETLAADNPEVAQWLAQLGYFPQRKAETQRLIKLLKASIATVIPDFQTFRTAVVDATRQLSHFDGNCPENLRRLLAEVARAASDQNAVLQLLNRNPLADGLPFVERVPVRRQGETTWIAPVQSTTLVKRPVDTAVFLQNLSAFESHFNRLHPAIDEGARLKVLNAIGRVRRELDKPLPYVPEILQSLEARTDEYHAACSVPVAAVQLLQILEEGRAGRSTLNRLGSAAETYLREPAFRSAWLMGNLLQQLLAPPIVKVSSLRLSRSSRMLASIREEIATGHYDRTEIIRRLRHLEQREVYFSTFVYALLQSESRPLYSANTHDFEVKSAYRQSAGGGGTRV